MLLIVDLNEADVICKVFYMPQNAAGAKTVIDPCNRLFLPQKCEEAISLRYVSTNTFRPFDVFLLCNI